MMNFSAHVDSVNCANIDASKKRDNSYLKLSLDKHENVCVKRLVGLNFTRRTFRSQDPLDFRKVEKEAHNKKHSKNVLR